LSKSLDRFADDRCDLRGGNSKLALDFEPRARLHLLSRKSVDAFQ